jgi:hypothetical protein
MSIAQSNTGSHQYGAGIYRRRITIETKDQQVNVEMEDDPHGFKLQLNHDKQKITDIQVETLRYPYDTCPGATDKVRSLIGNSLSAVKIYRRLPKHVSIAPISLICSSWPLITRMKQAVLTNMT